MNKQKRNYNDTKSNMNRFTFLTAGESRERNYPVTARLILQATLDDENQISTAVKPRLKFSERNWRKRKI